MSRIQALVILLFTIFAPAAVSAADPATGKAGLPATPEAWLAQMLDGRKNGVAFKDPAAFAEWLDAITEPRFMTALAAAAADPATYPKALSDAIDPATARNWSEFTDPQLYLRWMLASANPSFQQAIISRMTDPAKTRHWLDALNRPEAYAPAPASFGQAPMAWLQAPMNSATPMIKLAQPATAMAWFGALSEGVARQADGQEWLKLPADRIPGTGANVRYRY